MSLEFTTIQHGFRKANDLTCNEYVICDMVYHLSKWNDTPFPGWCYMKRESMALEVGLSERSVITLLQKMVEAGFIEMNPLTKHVRPTKKWQQVYCKVLGEESSARVKKVQSKGEESSPEPHEESSAHTNSINKNSINTGAAMPPIELTEEEKVFASFQKWIEANAKRVNQLKEPITKEELTKLLKAFDKEKVKHIFEQMHNRASLLKDYVSAYKTAMNWLKKETNRSAAAANNLFSQPGSAPLKTL